MQAPLMARAREAAELPNTGRSIPNRSRFVARKVSVFTTLALILCLILTFTTVPSCQAHRAEIAVIPVTTATVMWEAEHAGAESAARRLGLRIRWNAPTRESDVESQIGLVNRPINERCRGIILTPDEPRALMVPVQRALAAGMRIVVVGVTLPLAPQRNLSYIVADDEEIGRIGAMRIDEILHGRGEVAVVGVDPYSLNSLAVLSSFVSLIEQRFPKISIVDRRSATSSVLDSALVVNQVLLSHPHVGAIFALDSRGAIGAYYALKTRPPTNRAKVVGVEQTTAELTDAIAELTNAMRLHQIDSIIAEDTYRMGYRAVESLARGEANRSGVLKLVPMLITADNVNSTAARPFIANGWRPDHQ
jgi:ribose transport system substrate-binding protein